MLMCSVECRQWARDNWRWLLFGSTIVCSLYVLGGSTFWLVARHLWLTTSPIKILSATYTAPKLVIGARTTMQLSIIKLRECNRAVSLVFIDADDREESFLFNEMPVLIASGDLQIVTFGTVVRGMAPGTYRYQIRGSYTCPNGGFSEASPLEVVEVLATPLSFNPPD